VLAAPGYPSAPRTGDVVEGLERAARHDGVEVFHAATRRAGSEVRTAGGRVLAVTAVGGDLEAARDRAYAAAAEITWPGVHYRRDIAAQAIAT